MGFRSLAAISGSIFFVAYTASETVYRYRKRIMTLIISPEPRTYAAWFEDLRIVEWVIVNNAINGMRSEKGYRTE